MQISWQREMVPSSGACVLASALAVLLTLASAVPLSEFFPFGDQTGDGSLYANDDDSSLLIQLDVPFVFFDVGRRDLYVSTR